MEIKIDYDDFKQELDNEHMDGFASGIDAGVTQVMKWLESGQRLYDYLKENQIICCHEDVSSTLHWGRIAIKLGRESELKKQP